jgi:hypothetical protein
MAKKKKGSIGSLFFPVPAKDSDAAGDMHGEPNVDMSVEEQANPSSYHEALGEDPEAEPAVAASTHDADVKAPDVEADEFCEAEPDDGPSGDQTHNDCGSPDQPADEVHEADDPPAPAESAGENDGVEDASTLAEPARDGNGAEDPVNPEDAYAEDGAAEEATASAESANDAGER